MNHKQDSYLLKVILISIFLFVVAPISFGFLGTTITSIGYFPNIENKVDFRFFYSLLDLPGLHKSMFLTIFVGRRMMTNCRTILLGAHQYYIIIVE